MGNDRVCKIGRVDDSTFIKEASFEVFKDGYICVRETRGTVMHGDVVDGVLVVSMDCFPHFDPKINYFNKIEAMVKRELKMAVYEEEYV
ncbi:hypothetical protein Tco_0794109 [Tanacetum coccineum]